MDQFTALTIIGVVILVIGLALWALKKRGGVVVTLLGALWLFTMVLYYGLVYAGIYGTEFHIAKNVIGLLILLVGAFVSVSYLRKAKRGGIR